MENLKYHTTLSNYFLAQPLFFDENLQKKPHIRKCVELPLQQTKAELWDEVTNTLCNLDFIQAKAVAKMTYDLVKDFNDVLEVIPDNAENIRQEKARQARMDKYTHDLIAYAKGKIKIEELEIPKSITPWPLEKIDAEIERMKANPTRVDRLREFLNFLGIESDNLQKYAGEILYFAVQQAWNYADDGMVSKTAKQTDPEVLLKLLLLNKAYIPIWNPFPQAQKKITGHTGSVNSVSMTPDGRHALTGSADTTCIYWDLVIGQAIKVLKGHSGSVNSVSMTPDGKYAFTGSNDKVCIFWDIETGQALKLFKGHSEYITSVDITPDAKFAVSGSKDDTCIIWDIESEQQLKTLRFFCGSPFYDGVSAVCISQNGKFVLSCSLDFPYYLIHWDSETGKIIGKFADCKKKITNVHFTPDGKCAISSCADKTIIFYDLETGQLLKRLQGHKDSVNSISLTPDKKLALSASSDKTSILWDLETTQSVKTMEGHSWGINSVDITPDGKYALTGSGDKTCIFGDLEIGRRIEIPAGHTDNFNLLKVSVDGRRAVSGSEDRTCILWDIETGKVLKSLTGFDGESNVVLTHDGKKAITFDRYDLTYVLELDNGSSFQIPTGRRFGIDSICLSPNGKHIISSSDDGTLVLREMTNGETLRILRGHTLIVDTISITPDGKYAISASRDKTCILWDLDKGELLNSFKGHNDIFPKFDIMFTPDGKCVLSGSVYDIYMLWSLDYCKSLKTLGERSDKIESIIITPDGRRALSYATHGICVLWDIKTGLALKTLEGNDFKEIKSINVTPDGENIVSISYNNSCIIWNLKSCKILQRYVGQFSFETLDIYSKGIVIGETTGKIITLNPNPEIFCPGPLITTIRHLWDFDKHQFLSPSVDCPSCGFRFDPEASVLTTIEVITKKAGLRPEQSPCLELPDEAWEDPGLLSNCPKCKAELKFNPFIAGGDY